MNSVNKYGNTPLMIAAYNYHAEGIRILLEAGADVNQENLKGEAPLISAMYGMIDTRCINLYIASGADVNSKMYD